MKILHINTYGNGGAAKACIRLHEGLLKQGIDSKLLLLHSGNKKISNSYQFIPPLPDRWKKVKNKTIRILKEFCLYPKEQNIHDSILQNRPEEYDLFSFADSPFDIRQHPLYKEADIINLHWTTGFLDYGSFFRNNSKKIVWTLHDMNPFTGGCHYSGNCNGFENNCTNCPQLQGTINPDYSSKILETKTRSIDSSLNLTVVCLSSWLLLQSQKKSRFNKFDHIKIPNGLNSNSFEILNQEFSRELLGLPLDKKVILFVADSISNKRKGYDLLLKAVKQLNNKENIVLCNVGNGGPGIIENFNVWELGTITDERLMSAAYSAADVFIIPSIEDNLPNTVIESLMCGTPVIGFPIGGILDMIEDNKNGFLCESLSPSHLAHCIQKFLNSPSTFNRIEIRNEAIKKYNISVQTDAYIALYNKILKK